VWCTRGDSTKDSGHGRRRRTPATLALAGRVVPRRGLLASGNNRDGVYVDDRRRCLFGRAVCRDFRASAVVDDLQTLIAGTVLVLVLAVVVLLLETGVATAERRIERRLIRRSNDLRANLDAIRKELDEMQAASGRTHNCLQMHF
jgi:hypothetical protein